MAGRTKGWDGKLEVSSDGGATFFEIGSIAEVELAQGVEVSEFPRFGNSGYRDVEASPGTNSMSITFDDIPEDVGQQILHRKMGSKIHFKYNKRRSASKTQKIEGIALVGEITSPQNAENPNVEMSTTLTIEGEPLVRFYNE